MNSDGRRLRARALPLLAATLLSACYDGDPSDFREAVVAGRHDVTALAVDGEVPVIETGSVLGLRARASTPSGAVDLSREVTWRSADPAVLFVDAAGNVTALRNGTTQITAELAQFSDTVTITASDAPLLAITVTGDAAVDECGEGSYTASGQYADGMRDITARVDWSSSDNAVARMSSLAGERNRLVSRLAGTTGVTATRGAVSSLPFTVTVADNLDAIAVTPDAPSQLQPGNELLFTATGTWGTRTAVISRAADWSVANDDTTAAAIADVLSGDVNAGLLTARHGGTGSVLARCGGQSDDVDLTVVFLESLSIANTRPIELSHGESLLLTLEGRYSDGSSKPLNESADWSVSTVSGTPVTVSNADGTRGRVTAGSSDGLSTVTATVDGKSVAVSVSVVP